MAGKTLRVLCVHGLGDHRTSDWQTKWPEAVRQAFPQMQGLELDFQFVTYDGIFENIRLSPAQYAAAAFKLGMSGLSSVVSRQRGVLGDVSEKIKWTAGYVVAWVESEEFKRKSRKLVLDAIASYKPDLILAHSLGSLVTYNAFSHADAARPDLAPVLAKANYVTFGSQIANPFVIRNLTNGRVLPLNVAFWHHLYNPNDDVFTARISIPGAANFRQTETAFDLPGPGDHAAEEYFRHVATVENVWRPIGASALRVRSFGLALPKQIEEARQAKAPRVRKAQRALLVGINEYPDPSQRLEGCINDVFTMSSVLQDCGFPADTIRTCLDDRATAEGILSRMKWLLDDARPGDELVFYYSGHGARVPEYGKDFEPDHHTETLVPWDFDWTPEKYVSDDQIYDMYSQLPYDCRLIMIFDCCHSGDIHRDGGRRPRGLAPPDDIRHRELKWDSRTQMWVARDFERINEDFTRREDLAEQYFGGKGATRRIGRASMLRGLTADRYAALKKKDELLARGPYLPTIIEACREEEFSYEYRHGATSHGAFTFSLANILRRKKSITFEQLVAQTGAQLKDLRYDQRPQILGPSSIVKQKVPWAGA